MVHSRGLDRLGVGRVAAAASAPRRTGDNARHAIGVGLRRRNLTVDRALAAVDEHSFKIISTGWLRIRRCLRCLRCGRSFLRQFLDICDRCDVAEVGRQRARHIANCCRGTRIRDGRQIDDLGARQGIVVKRRLFRHVRDLVLVGDGLGHVEVGLAQVDVGGRDLDLLRRFDVDRLGALDLGSFWAGLGVHAVPLRPRAVGTLGADVRRDVALAFPREAEDGEFLVAGEFLHRAGLVALALCRDGRVLHHDVFAVAEGSRRAGDIHLAAAHVLGLEDLVAAECACGDKRDGGDGREDRGLPGRRRIQPTSLFHGERS